MSGHRIAGRFIEIGYRIYTNKDSENQATSATTLLGLTDAVSSSTRFAVLTDLSQPNDQFASCSDVSYQARDQVKSNTKKKLLKFGRGDGRKVVLMGYDSVMLEGGARAKHCLECLELSNYPTMRRITATHSGDPFRPFGCRFFRPHRSQIRIAHITPLDTSLGRIVSNITLTASRSPKKFITGHIKAQLPQTLKHSLPGRFSRHWAPRQNSLRTASMIQG